MKTRRKRSPAPRPGGTHRHRRVAVLIHDDCTLSRAKIGGVLQYLQKHPQWDIPLSSRFFPSVPDHQLRDWRGDGVILNAVSPDTELLQSWLSAGIAVVNTLAMARPDPSIPTVCVDSERLGRLAADHLLARKFHRYAFAGAALEQKGKPSCFRERGDAFEQRVRAHGFPCEPYWISCRLSANDAMAAGLWKHWLRQLARPIGIFACTDPVGFGLLQACRDLGIRVPDEVAVIGVDDDEMLCHLSIPRMTSIDPRGDAVGYLAAEMLDRMMNGDPKVPLFQVVPRGDVHLRASTDIQVSSNLEVTEALRFIHSHVQDEIAVGDVVRATTLSRRSLERHFRKVTGISIYQAIRNEHLDQACRLLQETNASLEEIARRSGFSSARRMNDAFRQARGCYAEEIRRTG